jgi:3-dehydroquinate dehydratase type I
MVGDGENVGQLIEQISQKKPDLVEFRLDNLQDFGILETIAQRKAFPAIATDKSNREPAVTEKLLLEAAAAGFEFVDIDLPSRLAEIVPKKIKSHRAQVIVSFHDLIGTPSSRELWKVLDSERKAGGDVCKIVTTALHPRDNLTILDFLENKPPETRLVSFAMGSLGTPSRILSPLFGAEFTFAALTEESRTAEGQLSIDNLRSVWQLLGIQ